MPRVAVVVLNYERPDLLDIAVPSILAQTDTDFELVIVDDGSRDDSVAHIRATWPGVTLDARPVNQGVTAAMNRAFTETDAEYVALLNNDLELTPDWLANAVAALDAQPRAASVTGKLLRFHDRTTIDATGDQLLPSGAALNRGAGHRDRGQYDAPGEVFSACGGAAVYRRAAIDQVGTFDADLIAYLEDVDWGFRARLLGWTHAYTPTAVAFHMGGATTGTRFGRLQRRNHLVVMVKDTPALARRLPMILAYQLAWFAASVRDGVALDHLRAWGDFVRMLPAVLRKRKALQAGRTVPASEIDRALRLGLPPQRVRRIALQLAPQVAGRRWPLP